VRKQILIAFGVLSLTGAAAFGLVQSNFTDVPAGHWAQEAVDYASKAGLVQGYPDQTFRGNKTLTRYEAAMIFYRLQKSGAMGNMTAEGQAAITAGMGDVQAELEDIKSKLDEADQAAQDQSARIDALEAATPGEPAASDTGDLEARLQALEDKVAEPASEAAAPDTSDLEARLKALEDKATEPAAEAATPDTTVLEDRLQALEDKAAEPAADASVSAEDVKALEDRIAELEAAPVPEATAPEAGADAAKVSALEEKLAALEKKVADQPAPAAGADAAKVSALEDRVTKLEGQVTALSSEVGSLKAAKPVEPVKPVEPTVTPPTEPVVTTPDVTPPVVETPAPRKPNLYVGAGANFPITPSGGGLGFSAVVGFKRFLGPIGLRVAADYNLNTKFLAVEPNLVLELNPDGFLAPYIGVGGGGVFGSPNSLFIGGAAGLGLNFTQNFGLFVEANPRYTLATGPNQFGVNLRAGLRFAF
jgi:uncharacterized coiled-coil protein SlyX